MELLQGKGAGKNGRLQGKANSLAKRAEVEALLQEHNRRRTAGEEWWDEPLDLTALAA